jgi:O-acetyl-ADP-ribose deacetylase (regulator of RNase III)
VNTVKGDLIKLAKEGHFDVIIHGCNCFCTMGAGIAKGIKAAFPEAYQADMVTEKGDKGKLGTYSSASVQLSENNLIVVNAYTQFNWRGKGNKADYEAIQAVFKLVKKAYSGKRIAFPLIGAGLAGGDWEKIASIISRELEGEHYTLVQYVP